MSQPSNIRSAVVPAFRALIAASAVVIGCALAWPLLPRSYDAVAEVALLPSDGGVEGAPRTLPDDAAVQTEVDRMTSGATAVTVAASLAPEVVDDLSAPALTDRVVDHVLGRFAAIEGQRREPRPPLGPDALARRVVERVSAVRERHGNTIALTATAGTASAAVTLANQMVNAYLAADVQRRLAVIEAEATRHVARAQAMASVAAASQDAVSAYESAMGLDAVPSQTMLKEQVASREPELGRPVTGPAASCSRQNPCFGLFASLSLPAQGRSAVAGEDVGHQWRSVSALSTAVSVADDQVARRRRDEAKLDALRRAAATDAAALSDATSRAEADLGRTVALKPGAELITPPKAGPAPTRPEPRQAIAGTLMAAILAGALAASRPWRRGVRA